MHNNKGQRDDKNQDKQKTYVEREARQALMSCFTFNIVPTHWSNQPPFSLPVICPDDDTTHSELI